MNRDKDWPGWDRSWLTQDVLSHTKINLGHLTDVGVEYENLDSRWFLSEANDLITQI